VRGSCVAARLARLESACCKAVAGLAGAASTGEGEPKSPISRIRRLVSCCSGALAGLKEDCCCAGREGGAVFG